MNDLMPLYNLGFKYIYETISFIKINSIAYCIYYEHSFIIFKLSFYCYDFDADYYCLSLGINIYNYSDLPNSTDESLN